MTASASRPSARPESRTSRRADDQRGAYAVFIAVIASALLVFGGLAYDAPRLNAARQNALHAANEAARVAAATIASGGTLEQARAVAEDRASRTRLIHGQEIHVAFMDCVGSLVQVTVVTNYVFRGAVLGAVIGRQTIEASGAAKAYLALPGDRQSELSHLGECPLNPGP